MLKAQKRMDAIVRRHAQAICENHSISQGHAALAEQAILRRGYRAVEAAIHDAEKFELQPEKALRLLHDIRGHPFSRILQIHPLADAQGLEHSRLLERPPAIVQPLVDLLRQVPPESEVPLQKTDRPRAWLQVKTAASGKSYPHSHIWAFAYPRLSESEGRENRRDLEILNQVTTEEFYRLHKGAVDLVGFNVMLEEGRPVLLISNVQHRRQYYDLNRTNKRRFNRAYAATLRAIRQWANHAGIQTVYHLDEEHAAIRMQQTYDARLPERAKEQFYRKAANNAGLNQRKQVKLTDPLNGEQHTLGVWASATHAIGTKPRVQEQLRGLSASTEDTPESSGRRRCL